MMTCRKSTAFLVDVPGSLLHTFLRREPGNGASWVSEKSNCMYENLTYIPHAAGGYLLNYSDKNIWNDVRQIIIYEKSQFN